MSPGDVVRLKSGGPLMTVLKVTEEDARCVWFSENTDMQAPSFATFILVALVVLPGSEKKASREASVPVPQE